MNGSLKTCAVLGVLWAYVGTAGAGDWYAPHQVYCETVYEARQVSLNRKVALKVISGSLGLSSKAVLRFQREAEAAGKLHHTNIVPIYATD